MGTEALLVPALTDCNSVDRRIAPTVVISDK